MLDKDKQIEEMAKIMCGFDDEECEHCITCSYHNGCACEEDAKNLYNAGYRKASDVAREIFEEIGKILYKYDKIAERDKSEYGELIVGDIACAIGELKKKYTEDEDA